jgi:putative transcription factor|tara:strand:- start:404 stop:769 length:366 start_codon:yes stop_codon:yes gene_type:complete
MFHQDWDEVTIHGKSVNKEKEKEKYVKFMGQEIKLPKRSQYSGKSPEQKLDEAELCGTHIKVSKETGLTIQRARVIKQYTQKDLASLINVSTDIISSYELGKSIPDHKIMQKLRRVLGVKL